MAVVGHVKGKVLVQWGDRKPVEVGEISIPVGVAPAPESERMLGFAQDINPFSDEHASHFAEHHVRRRLMESPEFRDGPENVILAGRAEGKTELALKWLLDPNAKTPRVLLVESDAAVRHLLGRAQLKRTDPRIMSYRTYRNGTRRVPSDTEIGIDDAGIILADLLGLPAAPNLLTITHAAPWQGRQEEHHGDAP